MTRRIDHETMPSLPAWKGQPAARLVLGLLLQDRRPPALSEHQHLLLPGLRRFLWPVHPADLSHCRPARHTGKDRHPDAARRPGPGIVSSGRCAYGSAAGAEVCGIILFKPNSITKALQNENTKGICIG